MFWRIFGLLLAVAVGAVLLYLSPFWVFEFWGREGLFGIPQLRPEGGLLGRWLRGTMFAPFDVLAWVVGAFLILTWTERIFALFNGKR